MFGNMLITLIIKMLEHNMSKIFGRSSIGKKLKEDLMQLKINDDNQISNHFIYYI